ncbi:MAG TPA: hypothetical protein VGB49_06500 [Caulobacteraceae bacterium]|jgi:hypothetical protein
MIRPSLAAVLLLLAACGSSPRAERARSGLADAVLAPLGDLNLRREIIPEVLIQAYAHPYDMRGLIRCSVIGHEVGRLDAALGPDLDEPAAPNGGRGAQALDALTEAALGEIRGQTTGFIPLRGWVRALSGADQHARDVQAGIQAGRLRRAYLKGVGMSRNCAPPAAPSWFRPRR